MAQYGVARAAHKTLSGTTVDTATFSIVSHTVMVTNRDTANNLWITFAFGGQTAATPSANADDSFIVSPNTSKKFTFGSGPTQVKVLGNGGAYDIEAA